MPETIDDARRLIESRLAEIGNEARRLQRVLGHLGEGESSPGVRRPRRTSPAKPGRRPGPRSKKPTGRAPRGRRREELLGAIGSSPGARPSELAATIGIRSTQVSVLIAKARAEGLIVKRGDGYALKK